MSKITELEQFLTPVLEKESYELVDLQYVSEGGQKVLRIFVDKEGGIKLADCEFLSGKVGELLDESNIIPDSYVLEVSSPGLDRILKKEKDFVKFIGKKTRITTFAPVHGQKNFLGEIVSCKGDKLVIDDDSGKQASIDLCMIARARLEPEI
jgi:ribosome maturation factor RimP